MQSGLVLALVELAKRPVEEVPGLAGANREIARAHVEEMQRVMAAIGDAATELRALLDHHEAERRGECAQGTRWRWPPP